MNYQDLEKMTVVKLREEASKLEDVKGVSGMKKEELIHLLCEKLSIPRPESKVEGVDKSRLKTKMRELKKRREEAVRNHDHQTLAEIRRRIRVYKRSLRKHTVKSA
jgi:DUF438 domain-containing protein